MMKIFCDHCGREIRGVEVDELSCDDCFYDHETREFVGSGYTLCPKCWNERLQAHINLDREFLNMKTKEGEEE